MESLANEAEVYNTSDLFHHVFLAQTQSALDGSCFSPPSLSLDRFRNGHTGRHLKPLSSPFKLLPICINSCNTSNRDSRYNQSNFTNEFRKFFLMTHRFNFRPLRGSNCVNFTSDEGWGGPIRAGQMLLLTTLNTHLSNRLGSEIELLSLVQENIVRAPYSVHSFCEESKSLGCSAGSAFSIGEVALTIEVLLRKHPQPSLKCIVFQESTILKNRVASLAGDRWENAVLVIVPVEATDLGFTSELFKIKQCVGIISDNTKASTFAVGVYDKSLIVLDPSVAQKACQSVEELVVNTDSYHPEEPLLLPFRSVGSSIAVGFYFRGSESFEKFEEQFSKIPSSPIAIEEDEDDFVLI